MNTMAISPADSSVTRSQTEVIANEDDLDTAGCKTTSEWKNVAEDFRRRWNFPMCLGAIDGKHIAFSPSASEGSFYYNYKGFNSVILLAVVDANYKFIFVDVGTNGRANDAAAFNASKIGDAIKQNLLNFPEDEELPNTNLKSQPILRLRLKKPKSDKKVGWQEGTVDNEHMGKKKSKCCCIYKKPVAFGESSSEDDEECEHCFGHPEKRRRNRKPIDDQPENNEPSADNTHKPEAQ